MKKLSAALLTLSLLLCLTGRAQAAYDPEVDYLSIMLRAAVCGDLDAGRAAEICRDEMLSDVGAEQDHISFEDLFWLSKIIAHEAGSSRLSQEWRLCVGEVVLNRVDSPEFPDTIREVIFQEGQYANVDNERFRTLFDPDEDSVRAALDLLQGERHMAPWVVFQANFEQGGGIYREFHDSLYGTTYFCTSSHIELSWGP